ncbi:MAG: polyprenyl synthetase family protein [Microbacteriaceae bacterium]
MAESTRLVDLVQARIDEFLAEQTPHLGAIAPELEPFITFSRGFLGGGKRFRALFCYWGWQAVASEQSVFDPNPDSRAIVDLPAVVTVASALEVFHAAALVHDDIMDNSDTRRGNPSAHKRFETMHRDGSWLGSPSLFGSSAALLLGDLLLSWSDELLDSGLRELPSAESARATRNEYNMMRTEVTVGQYLDILEENSWATAAESELLTRAHRVIVYKSAKYSVEAPLSIGAALGGASLQQRAALRDYGLPIGIAYQLRDDMLGVFGDPAVTGKPAGDDLLEGKRTVLVALARANMSSSSRKIFDELLGDRDLEPQQILMLQQTIRESGAIEKVEAIIDRHVGQAIQLIQDAPLSVSAREQLVQLADTVIKRAS